MDVIRTVSSFDTGLTLAFWLVAGEQAIYARHASRVLAPQRLMELPEQIPGAEASQFRLLGTRRFLPFFLTQFLGAFNDNLFRNAVVVSITFGATVAGRDAGILSNVSQGLFILPFFLFSALSGQLADKYEKSRLIRQTRFAEVLLMCAGAVALYYGKIPALLAVIFLLGVLATIFGPLKYSLMPQHLRQSELVGGNADVLFKEGKGCLQLLLVRAMRREGGAGKVALYELFATRHDGVDHLGADDHDPGPLQPGGPAERAGHEKPEERRE